jgi:purine-nucleoside phosphorylase
MNDLKRYKQNVAEAVAFLQQHQKLSPSIGIVLGTGLSRLPREIDLQHRVSFADIPHFPEATTPSHNGNLIFGKLHSREVVILQGRFHYYEGYSIREVTMPIRVLAELGVKTLIVTNAAGGLDITMKPGTILAISDHINLIGDNPLRGPNIDEWGPRFPDLSRAYDAGLLNLALESAKALQIDNFKTGIYIAIPGPSLETPAETNFYRKCGADAIGMSTVPEVIVAKHAGMKILGLSIIANINNPEDFRPILLEEVIAQAQKTEPSFVELIKTIIQKMG